MTGDDAPMGRAGDAEIDEACFIYYKMPVPEYLFLDRWALPAVKMQ